MPETISTTESCIDTTTIITENSADQTTTTETCTQNQTTTITGGADAPGDQPLQCPCGNLDLRKLVEKTRCWAFKSSNISAATANSVLIFALKILQEILIQECKSKQADINNIFLIAAAIAELAEVVKVYNPPPFNS